MRRAPLCLTDCHGLFSDLSRPGNTGIALAMAAAIKGYKMRLIMPANMSEERRLAMSAYGAELISVPGGLMETARDLAKQMEARGEGTVLDQFSNPANPLAHTNTTGPELWEQTGGRITHFVTSLGTTGTAMGVSRFLKSKNKGVRVIGLQPAAGASIPGIRRWPAEYMPSIFDASRVDETLDITQEEAEETMRALARCEGIFAGVSSGGCVAGALRVAATVENATIVCIICDRGVRFPLLVPCACVSLAMKCAHACSDCRIATCPPAALRPSRRRGPRSRRSRLRLRGYWGCTSRTCCSHRGATPRPATCGAPTAGAPCLP